MDLNHTSAFIRVVEEESFTAAAKALGLTTSTVSRSVAMLEEQLGVRLLQRTTRRVSLTDAGRAYFDRTHTPMAALRSASEDISQAGKEPRGVVRLTATLGFSVSFLPHVVADFIDRYPMVQFDLLFTSQPLDLVKENIDIAIRAGHLKESSLMPDVWARWSLVCSRAPNTCVAVARRRPSPNSFSTTVSATDPRDVTIGN
jgi:DNA-binding transcriptional LysR family regulator